MKAGGNQKMSEETAVVTRLVEKQIERVNW